MISVVFTFVNVIKKKVQKQIGLLKKVLKKNEYDKKVSFFIIF